MNDIAFLDATAQAELVRTKQIKPIELAEAAIERIEKLNPRLNAVITPMYDEARKIANGALPEGPFTGVPFLLKDLGASYKGVRQASGSRFTRDWISPIDSELTRRQKAAGLIHCGKTNTPEFGLVPTTEPVAFGACKNPWDITRSTGGSSGGSAAAVASGMVPMAHANDGGGSIRIPASCCGLFGLKPTRARITQGPAIGDSMSGLTVEHAVTRTVRDSAALLDATLGSMPGDPYVAPKPARRYVEELGADPGSLRIAVTRVSPTGAPVHPDCVAAVDDAAKLLADLGHHVEEAAPNVTATEQIMQAFISIWASGNASGIDRWAAALGKTPTPEEFEPVTWLLYQQGKTITGGDYLTAVAALQGISRQVAAFYEKFDIWLTPTLGTPPPALGYIAGDPGDPMSGFARAGEFVPFTPLINATGQPAASIPLFWNSEGIPIGTHFIARYGDEATIFRLAAQLEEARPWANKRPPVSA
ncbi:MAG: amidase [Chloroflexota bacterium]